MTFCGRWLLNFWKFRKSQASFTTSPTSHPARLNGNSDKYDWLLNCCCILRIYLRSDRGGRTMSSRYSVLLGVLAFAVAASAQTVQKRATFAGGGRAGSGRCVVE